MLFLNIIIDVDIKESYGSKDEKGRLMLKYKCIVFDHDDTVVMSTAQIHNPSFQETLAETRPDVDMSLEDFIMYCFEPGFYELCYDILKFDEKEKKDQYARWMKYVETHIPDFYPGVEKVINRQWAEGGLVCVVSHSNAVNIKRDYRNAGLREPDMVFGWELGEGKRKPSAYPIEMIMKEYGLEKSDILVIDDLKPGMVMAQNAGVDFACAGWSHIIPEIREYMMKNCKYYFKSIDELNSFCF